MATVEDRGIVTELTTFVSGCGEGDWEVARELILNKFDAHDIGFADAFRLLCMARSQILGQHQRLSRVTQDGDCVPLHVTTTVRDHS